MKQLHQKLVAKNSHYKKWHEHKYHSHVHWLSLGLVFVLSLSVISGAWSAVVNEQDNLLSNIINVSQAKAQTSKGQLTSYGSKWGWTGTGEAFIPQLVMGGQISYHYNNPQHIDSLIEEFIVRQEGGIKVEQGFNGFVISVACRWFDVNNDGNCRNVSGKPEPDPRTFIALKNIIQKVYAAGGMTHIWVWGDDERGQTPKSLSQDKGLNGTADIKVQNMIASELGSLPGWTMGYGFDLDEWASINDVRNWQKNMQSYSSMNPEHFFGGRPSGPNGCGDHSSFRSWNKDLDYSSYEHHKPDYDCYVRAMENTSGQPVFSEDRNRTRGQGRSKDYDGTLDVVRGLWQSAMAGGVANIWGHLPGNASKYYEQGSAPYGSEVKKQIKTYSRFFADRFQKDMVRCQEIVTDSTTKCLRSADWTRYILYHEGNGNIAVDLTDKFSGSLTGLAVDALANYSERALGGVNAQPKTFTVPDSIDGDWAIAIGNFGNSDFVQDCFAFGGDGCTQSVGSGETAKTRGNTWCQTNQAPRNSCVACGSGYSWDSGQSGCVQDISATPISSIPLDQCQSRSTVACFEGDLYWYDSCGKVDESDKFEDCGTLRCVGQECVSPPQCSNKIDDDGDGAIDYPQDPGCTSVSDDNEFNSPGGPPPGGSTTCTVTVPANSSTGVNSSCILKQGSTYEVKATGTYGYWIAQPQAIADANLATDGNGNNPQEGGVSGVTDRFKLQINNTTPNWQGTWDSHQYTTTVTGQGQPAKFYIKDDFNEDNSGSLQVTITGDFTNDDTDPEGDPPADCGLGTPGQGGPGTPDITNDGCVDEADLSIFLSCWGTTSTNAPAECFGN